MLIVFDTETTDLKPGSICQLAYVIDDGVQPRGVNRFFCVAEMSRSAQAVHGLSMDFLRTASGGHTFADELPDIDADFRAATSVAAHNLDFDAAFMRAEYERAGRSFHMKHGVCTMYAFTKAANLPSRRGNKPKPPKLSELMAFFGVDEATAARRARDLFGDAGIAHDARYDAAAAWLCLREAMDRRLIRNLLPEHPGQASFLDM